VTRQNRPVPISTQTVAAIPVGLDPEGTAVDTRRRRAYVACSRSDTLAVVDLAAAAVVTHVAVGAEPIDVVFDERTDRIFTADAHADALSVVAVAMKKEKARVAVGA